MKHRSLFEKFFKKKENNKPDELQEALLAGIPKKTLEDFERAQKKALSDFRMSGKSSYNSFSGVDLKAAFDVQSERRQQAEAHAEKMLRIKQDNALNLINRHCLACRGYIGESLMPPRVELTRRNPDRTHPEMARLAITCPVCGYVMLFDVEISATDLEITKEPQFGDH